MKNFLLHMKMSNKLMLSSAVSLFSLLLLGAVAYSGLHTQTKSINDIYNIRFKTYETCANRFGDISQANTGLYKLISWTGAKYDSNKVSELGQDVQRALKESTASLVQLQKASGTSAEEKKLLQPILAKLNEYDKSANDLIDMLQTDLNAATMFMGSTEDAFRDIKVNFDKLLVLEKSLSNDQYATAIASSNRTNLIVITVLIVAFILSFTISTFLHKIILAPVRETVAGIERVAAGDFTRKIDVASRDEVGQMAGNFNQLLEKLNRILREVAETSTKVAVAANQLRSTSEQMATGTEQVATQASTVATAGEEMAATSDEIAQNCNLAAQKGNEANLSARSGATVVEESVRGMEKIALQVKASAKTMETLGQRSNQIGEIIGTIEDIADQTNLLALNAAIEAARAGEQGRGFAVVADEVRALAERTTKATKEIGTMIKAIQLETENAVGAMGIGVKEVEEGTQRAATSGQAIQDILNHISEVTMQVNQIATAAAEQTATTGEISNNIQQINQVVNQTARGAQETASAASQLSHLSGELQQLVAQFKLAA